MEHPKNRKRILLIIAYLILIPTSGYLFYTLLPKKSILSRHTPPHTLLSSDTLFWAETSDNLKIDDEPYLISHSPIFGLPDALDLFPFKNCTPFSCTYFLTPQFRDKEFDIYWILRQKKLLIHRIRFNFDEKKVKKRYPDKASYFKPIAEANKKFQLEHPSDTALSNPDSWKYDSCLHATWYTGILYAQKVKYCTADSVQIDGVYKKGYPVLKLVFQNGTLIKQENLWQNNRGTFPAHTDETNTDTISCQK